MTRRKKGVDLVALELDNRRRIVEQAKELFFKYGYSKVTVDEIAKALGMSKRTMYMYFPNKLVILDEIINIMLSNLRKQLNEVINCDEPSYTKKLGMVFTVVAVELSRIAPSFIYDLRINLPEEYAKISNFKKEVVFDIFGKLLREGRLKGYIHKDVSIEIAMAMLFNSIENLLDPAFYNQLPNEIRDKFQCSTDAIYDSIVKILYMGILTEETRNSYIQ